MKNLWSPWRMSYINSPKNLSTCVFCTALNEFEDEQNYILHRARYCFVIMNKYPYTSGHLMVLPFQHVPTLTLLQAEARSEMMEMVNHCTEVIDQVYQPQGFNLGANIGEAAGAGIEAHVHLHIVPRWKGDTSFMSAVGSTRVIPEDLPTSYKKTKSVWNNQIKRENNGNL